MNFLAQNTEKHNSETPPEALKGIKRVPGILLWLLAAVILVKLALVSLLIPAAILYVVAFGFVSYYYPGAALMLIFASAPFQNDLSGGGGAKFSIAEINLLLTLPVLYLR